MQVAKLLRIVVALIALSVVVALFAPSKSLGISHSAFVPAVSTQEKDMIGFRKDVVVSRAVEGDAVVLGGSLRVDARVSGDVVVLGGDLVLGPTARVDGDVICFGGTVAGLTNGKVGGEVMTPGNRDGALPFKQLMGRGPSLSIAVAALKIASLLLWLLAALLVTAIAGREVRTTSLELRAGAAHLFVTGLVTFTSLVLSLIVVSYVMPVTIAIPLIVMIGVIAVVAKIYGMIGVFHAVGVVAIGLVTRARSSSFVPSDVTAVTTGLLLLGLVRMIPVVGNVAWMMASVFAIGAALATGFGRREPWFLAFRPLQETSG